MLYNPCQRDLQYVDVVVGGARGAMVIVSGNGHDDRCSNPGRY